MSDHAPSTPPARLVAVRFDANDPLGLARFWAVALRWAIDGDRRDGARLVPSDATPVRIELVSAVGTKSGKNRVHLDLTTASLDDQQGTVARLVELGARHIDVGQGPADRHVVLADPEGNELCIIEPDNTFLAGCGRLGSITCDGSRDVGCFWSAALGWPLVWDQDGETAIRAPGGAGPFVTWGPPVPAPGAPSRVHLVVAPPDGGDQPTTVERLVALGATPLGGDDGGRGIALADPDGHELRVVAAP